MKKLTALLLTLAMALTLTACGGVSRVEVGDTIEFGGLNWLVLEVQGGKALILCEKVLEARAFNSSTDKGNAWETSDIREYLNGTFYESTFSSSEKRKIAKTRLTNKSGNNTDDKVFLLSVDEVNEYMGENSHINMRNAKIAENITTGERSSWWLRSPGFGSIGAAGVDNVGLVGVLGGFVIDSTQGVRPALWLNP